MSRPGKTKLQKLNDVDLKLLRVFQGVVNCGGFSAAESQLNIARSTISTHMADLETRLGLTLCQRGRGGFALTDEGKVVFDAVDELFGQLDQFRHKINGLHQQLTGELNLMCSDAIVADPRFKLTRILETFNREAPEVVINISTNTLPEMEQALLDGRADVCFAPKHRELSSLNYQSLYSEDYFLYCHHNHPLFSKPAEQLTQADLAQCRFVHPGIQTSGQASLAMKGLTRAANAYIYEVRMALVNTGRFIGYFPSHYVQPQLAAGSLRALMPQSRHYCVDVALLTRQTATPNKMTQRLLHHLQAVYGESGDN